MKIASTCQRTRFLSFPGMPWSSHGSNDRKYSYFTRIICNRYVDSFKILIRTGLWTARRLVMFTGYFKTWSQACSAIVTTIWRSPAKKQGWQEKTRPRQGKTKTYFDKNYTQGARKCFSFWIWTYRTGGTKMLFWHNLCRRSIPTWREVIPIYSFLLPGGGGTSI